MLERLLLEKAVAVEQRSRVVSLLALLSRTLHPSSFRIAVRMELRVSANF